MVKQEPVSSLRGGRPRTWYEKVSIQPDFPAYLLVGALLVYYLLRLIRLVDFPIFFFTDEAIHTLLAADLVKNGLWGSGGEFLPVFFKSGETYNAGFPVYLQILPAILGIRSAFMTRFVSVTTSLLAAIGLGLIFSRVHNDRRGWLAVLILSILPAWFYHSRTAFETVEAVSFFSVFLMGYVNYRRGSFYWLYVSLAAGALAFYSYSPARIVVAFLAALLLVSDARYHWENRRKLWKLALAGLVISIPYIRFLFLHPGENLYHLELLQSYWVKPEPVSWKILQYISVYLQGLNPNYWFIPHELDLPRHTMKGLGHLGWYFFPFFIGGLYISIRRWKTPGYRVMLFSLLAAPAGAAVVQIGITRALFMVIPAAFFISVGFDFMIDWFQSHLKIRWSIDLLLCVLLIAANFLFLDRILTEGPLWFTNYGMSGMQYGSEQVFTRIKEIRKQDPNIPIVLSPDWANGTDVLARFYLGEPIPIVLADLDAYTGDWREFPANTVFIMTPGDLKKVITSGKFEPMQVIDVLFYPDGKPGFVFAHLAYNKLARQEFEEEKAARSLLEAGTVSINGETVEAVYSRLDLGDLQQLFDDDHATLIRSKEANPLMLEFAFPHPMTYDSIRLRVGGPATRITIYVLSEGSTAPLASGISVLEMPMIRDVNLPIPTRNPISRLRIEVQNINDNKLAHVHLWDIELE